MLVFILVGWPIYGEIKGYSQFLNAKLFVTCAKMYILRVRFRISHAHPTMNAKGSYF